MLDHGRVVGHRLAGELKARIGGERVEVTAPEASDLEAAAGRSRQFADGDVVRRRTAARDRPGAAGTPG